MALPYLPYARQSIEEEDIASVAEALKEELITRGPPVQRFEKTLAEYCQVPYAVAFNSGTAALMAAYFAAGLTAFDRVMCTPNTFIASVGAAIQAGIRPNFVDIDRQTGNLNLSDLERALNASLSTEGRSFIIPVHFGGLAIDMQALHARSRHLETVIIEDAAHALGSYYPTGQRVGSCAFSQLTIFSFHPAKTLTTGEGGMVTTRDPELYHRLQLYRDNGIERTSPYLRGREAPGYYEAQAITGNFNLTSFQAALGLSQFKRLEMFILKRRTLVNHYRKRLLKIPAITCFADGQDEQTAFHLFVVQIDFQALGKEREQVMLDLKKRGIGTQVHYIPLYEHPVFSSQHLESHKQCPEMNLYYRQALSLPLYVDLTLEDVDRVCDELEAVLTTAHPLAVPCQL